MVNKKYYTIIVLVFAIIISIAFSWFAISEKNLNWFGVSAGILAIIVVLSLSSEYFSPKKGSKIKAPNRTVRIVTVIIAIPSEIYWVISAWPGFFK